MKSALKIFLSLIFLSLFIPSTGFAVSFNKQPTATPGPGSYFFEDFKDDPTYEVYQDVTHPLTIDLINTAYVVGWNPSKFLPQFEGNTEYINKTWFKKGDAIINLGIVDVFGNTALENDVILAKGDDTVPTYIRLNTSPADTYGNPFNESCYYSNEGDQQKCLEEHDALFDNGSVNVFSISTPLQRRLPLETQKQLADKQSQQRLDCSSDDSKKNIECDNYYYLKEGVDEKEVAKNTLNTSYEEYLEDPEDHQDIFAQKTGDGGLVPFAYVVTKEGAEEQSPGILNFLGTVINLISNNDDESFPIVAIGWIPTIRGTATNTQILRNTFFPYSLQEPNDTALYDYLYTSIDWAGVDGLKEAFVRKAQQTPHMMAPTNPKSVQFTGASIKTQPDDSIFSFLPTFTLKDPENAVSEEFTIYKTTLILPKHIIQKKEYLEKLSQTLFPEILTNFPESFQEIPLDNSYQSAEFEQKVEVPCTGNMVANPDDNKCYEYASLDWEHDIAKSGVFPESETDTRVYTANQLGLPLNHSGYFKSTCIFNELSSRIPGLASIIGAASKLFNNSCPEQLRETDNQTTMENVDLFVDSVDTEALINSLLQTDNGAFWKDWYPDQPVHHCLNSNSYSDTCKQHLFEKSCNGQLCYQYIINAAKNTVCAQPGPNQGKFLNPYYAIAIALNENGGLVSDRPNAADEHHFGCDEEGLKNHALDIPSKTACMTGTLVGRCGLPDKENLKIYGYGYDYVLKPLEFLYNSPK